MSTDSKSHPCERISPKEIFKAIYEPPYSLEGTVDLLRKILGGCENVTNVEWLEDFFGFDRKGNTYKIEVKDLEKTEFKKKNIEARLVGARCCVYLDNDGIIKVSCASPMDGVLKDMEKYFEETD